MRPHEVSFNNLPEAIAQILTENIRLQDTVQTLSDKVEELSAGKEVMDVEHAAKFINKTVPALYTMVSRGDIPYHKPDKNLQFLRSELLEWVRTGRKSEAEKATGIVRRNVVALNKK